MYWQVLKDYGNTPDPRTLTLSEARWYYAGLIPELKESTRPKG